MLLPRLIFPIGEKQYSTVVRHGECPVHKDTKIAETLFLQLYQMLHQQQSTEKERRTIDVAAKRDILRRIIDFPWNTGFGV